MQSDAIREAIRQEPFVPFEVITTSGERHLIDHPEMMLLLKTQIAIGRPDSDRITRLSQLHISELRELETGATG